MGGKRLQYTTEQLLFLKRNRRKPRALATELFNDKFGTAHTVKQIHALCVRKGYSGKCARYKKGHVAWNADLKGMGVCKPNSGTFRRGHVPGNFRCVGSEHIDVDGYVWVKTKNPNTWRAKHVLVWEAHNGPVPAGHVVRFRDHTPCNCSIDNLELMSRNLHCRLNKLRYDSAPEKIQPSVMLMAKIQAAYSRRSDTAFHV